MGSPWRLRGGFATSSRALHEDVAGAEGSKKPPRRLREGSAKASRRRHGRLHLETIRQIMTSPHNECTQHVVSLHGGHVVPSALRSSTATARAFVVWNSWSRRYAPQMRENLLPVRIIRRQKAYIRYLYRPSGWTYGHNPPQTSCCAP